MIFADANEAQHGKKTPQQQTTKTADNNVKASAALLNGLERGNLPKSQISDHFQWLATAIRSIVQKKKTGATETCTC